MARRTQTQPSSFKGIVVGAGEGAQGGSRGLVVGGAGGGGGGGGEGIVDGYDTVVEELGADGRYAVEQSILRIGLDDRSKTARWPNGMRIVHDHGKKSETKADSALGDFLYAPCVSVRASHHEGNLTG